MDTGPAPGDTQRVEHGPALPLQYPERDDLRQVQDRFIAAWGRMSGAWGISRTMAEVLALLYIGGRPMCTDEVMERLEISRGNASMSLRSLMDWGVVARTHKRGDRKEYFQAESDVWALFRAIVRERMKREVDPLLAELHEIIDLTGVEGVGRRGSDAVAVQHHKRLEAMVDFFTTIERLGQRFVSPSGRGLRIAATLLASTTPAPKPRRKPPGGAA